MKKIIDERQERDMYLIEHRGFWLAFYGLLGIILYKVIMNYSFQSFIMEFILFIILALLIIIGCSQKGIWRPTAKPSQKEYIMTAGITFIGIFVLFFLIGYMRGRQITISFIAIDILISFVGGLITYVFSYVLGRKIIKND